MSQILPVVSGDCTPVVERRLALRDVTAIECRCSAPVHTCNDDDVVCEQIPVLGLAPRRRHVGPCDGCYNLPGCRD